jgi:hypothetical protein
MSNYNKVKGYFYHQFHVLFYRIGMCYAIMSDAPSTVRRHQYCTAFNV